MIRKLLLLFLSAAALSAQVPTFRQVIDDLSRAASDTAIVLPDAFFAHPANTSAGQLQRGAVLYAAAGKAKEIGNPERARLLVVHAKTCLANAMSGSLSSAQRSQACYTLGLIAERYEGNLTAALSYYQSALSHNSDNRQAREAAARVQAALAP